MTINKKQEDGYSWVTEKQRWFKNERHYKMNVYLMLFVAIGFEVIGTMLLPASQNFTKIIPTSVLLISYGMSFYFLAIVSQKLPLSVVYASWSGIGIFSIAIFSYIFYKQTLNWEMALGLFLIVIGVTIVNLYKV